MLNLSHVKENMRKYEYSDFLIKENWSYYLQEMTNTSKYVISINKSVFINNLCTRMPYSCQLFYTLLLAVRKNGYDVDLNHINVFIFISFQLSLAFYT